MSKQVAMILFDLPSTDKEKRRYYRKFRKELLKLGFIQFQESVYIKLIKNNETYNGDVKQIEKLTPPNAKVNSLLLTLNQFRSMHEFGENKFNIELFSDDIIFI